MSVNTDLFAGVQFSDGEGVDFGDLKNSQTFMGSRLFDQLVGKSVPGDLSLGASGDADFPAQFSPAHAYWAIALSVGGGMPRQGSANNKILMGAGTVLQCIGSDTGTEPVFLPFTFSGTQEFTVPNGDVSNPRMDLLQMKLEWVDAGPELRDFQDDETRAPTTSVNNKRRRVQATISVKSGAAASTPTIPDCDSGYCALALVKTPTGYTGTGAFGDFGTSTPSGGAQLADMRMPVNVTTYRVPASLGGYDPSVWVPGTIRRSIKCNTNTISAVTEMYIPCPQQCGRIVGVSITSGGGSSSGTPSLGVLQEPSGFDPSTDLSSIIESGSTAVTRLAGLSLIETATTVCVRSATQGLGLPIWANGRGRPVEVFRLGSGVVANATAAVLFFNAKLNTEVWQATFYVAQGW